MKKRSFEVEANRWEEMKREGKVDNCRLWLPLEVEGERTLALYDTGIRIGPLLGDHQDTETENK